MPNEYIDVLKLTFLLLPDRSIADNGQTILDSIEKHVPKALPVKWVEPFYKRRIDFTGKGDSDFIDLWRELGDDGDYLGIAWGADVPFLTGSARVMGCWPRTSDFPLAPDYLELQFSLTDIKGNDHVLIPDLINQFIELSKKLNAIYSAAFVLRNLFVEDGMVGFDWDDSEFVRDYSDWFDGVPKRSWLTWFGGEFQNILQSSLNDCELVQDKSSSGCLLVTSPLPLNDDDLRGVYPKFPRKALSDMAVTERIMESRRKAREKSLQPDDSTK